VSEQTTDKLLENEFDNLPMVTFKSAKEIFDVLTVQGKWQQIVSKDVPHEILNFVSTRIKAGKNIDQIREALGMRSPTDVRWRKIMNALRTSKRVDASAIFVKWLERNEEIGDRLNYELNAAIKEKKPLTAKAMVETIRTLSQLQLNTVKLGKELGIFVDPAEKVGQGQVTIVVNTNVPSPDEKTIIVHQEERMKKNQELLEMHRK
jgi:hypothetical protein